MNNIASIILAILFCVIIGIFGLIVYNNLVDSQADLERARGEAQALIINAQGQARLDSAQAFAVTSGAFTSAAMPWLVVVVSGAMFFGSLIYLRSQPQPPQRYQPPMIIERQVLLLQPGQAEMMAAEWQRENHRIDG